MPGWDEGSLSEPQRRWFASLRETLERETGRSLQDWAALARACPESRPRARLAWMKATYGLGQNRAALVLAEAFPSETTASQGGDPLWRDPAARAARDAVHAAVEGVEGLVVGPRKGFTAFSRRLQFAAVRPLKAGVRLGLAVRPEADPRLSPRGRESWSERLAASLDLAGAEQVDAGVAALLARAAEGA